MAGLRAHVVGAIAALAVGAVVISAIRSNRESDQLTSNVREFQVYDRNSDGRLDYDEFKRVVKDHVYEKGEKEDFLLDSTMRTAFHQRDSNKDSYLQRPEYAGLIQHEHELLSRRSRNSTQKQINYR